MNKTWATIFMVFGAFATMGAISNGNILGAFIPLVLSVSGFYFRNKALALETKEQRAKFFPTQPKFEINDDFVIRLAKRLNNRLSVEDLLTQTSLTSEDAKNHLDKLAQKGICEIRLHEVQNSGKIYYYFD